MKIMLYEMIEWIRTYYGSGIYLITAIASYMYLFATSKEDRKRLVYPVLLMTFLILNPLLYKYIYNDTRYWRWLWAIPNVYVIAAALIRFLKTLPKRWEKIVVLAVLLIPLMVYNHNFYRVNDLFITQNVYKIEQETIDVCDLMLEQDETPKCICPWPLRNRVRVYSGEITQLYGRYLIGPDVSGEIAHEMEQEKPDYRMILKNAKEYECNFIVTSVNREIGKDILQEFGFVEIGKTQNYTVYMCRE